jgi:hypothetical protein
MEDFKWLIIGFFFKTYHGAKVAAYASDFAL